MRNSQTPILHQEFQDNTLAGKNSRCQIIADKPLYSNSTIISTDLKDCMLLKNGELFWIRAAQRKLELATGLLLRYAAYINEHCYLFVDINFNLLMSKDCREFKKLILRDMYNNVVKLAKFNIRLAASSPSGRFVAMVHQGWLNKSMLVIDVANQRMAQFGFSAKQIEQIVWAPDENELGVFGGSELLVIEMQNGDNQRLQLGESIKTVEFINDKVYVITTDLLLTIFRKAQWVNKEQPNIILSYLFPQWKYSTSSVQYYSLAKTKLEVPDNRVQIPYSDIQLIKCDGQIQKIILHYDGRLWKYSLNDPTGQFQLLQDNRYNEHVSSHGVEPSNPQINIRVQGLQEASLATVIQIIRLHRTCKGGIYVNEQTHYI